MEVRTEQSEANLSRTVELAHHDNQAIGAPLFLSVSELRAVGIDICCVDRLLFEIVDTRHGSVIKISGQTGSEIRDGNSSLTD
jgi:hypothetical protein